MLVGTGGTTGRPKGVMLTGRNLETMTALTLMSYPFEGRPVYLALAPLTHAAGVLCFPVMALGGEIVVMPTPDLGEFLALDRAAPRHAHVPAADADLHAARPPRARRDRPLVAAVLLVRRGADVGGPAARRRSTRIGPVMAQLFGQTEAPMMISTMAPADHFRADGSVAHPSGCRRPGGRRRSSPSAIMDDDGRLLPAGERGEIVVRSSLVMAGYYKNPEATAEASAHGWHHTGDIGYLDDDNYLFIVDRAKDMIITGGFNVYSAEVEQALHGSTRRVQDCAVVGLPDDKWGERVTAVVQLQPGRAVDRRRV